MLNALLTSSIYVKAVFSVSLVVSKLSDYENKEYCESKIIHWN